MPAFYCSYKNDHKKPVLQSEVLEELAIRLLSSCDNFYFQIADSRLNSEKMTPLVGMVGLALYPSILSETMNSGARHHRSG